MSHSDKEYKRAWAIIKSQERQIGDLQRQLKWVRQNLIKAWVRGQIGKRGRK